MKIKYYTQSILPRINNGKKNAEARKKLSSTTCAKILIIPDIHTKFFDAERIINHEKPDKTVFLGDYFDAFDDSLEITQLVGEWLKESMTNPKRIHLLGNHDLSYMNPKHACSGFSEGKLFTIKNTKVDLSKLLHYYWVGDWLCTHAGLSNDFYHAYSQGLKINEFLEDYSNDLKLQEKLYDCSLYRGGRNAFGGIVWCDYDEFVDIPNVKQVFGHTKSYEVRKTENHICLDTGLNNYAVYENNEMIIKSAVNQRRTSKQNTDA
jgi:Calcineurin-like phosphoesterase